MQQHTGRLIAVMTSQKIQLEGELYIFESYRFRIAANLHRS